MGREQRELRHETPMLLLCCLAAALLLSLAPPAHALAPEPWRVVLIRNWDSQYTINMLRERALREALLRDAPRVVEIYPEEVDPLRFHGADIEDEFLVLLRKKYRNLHIDLVIASGAEPLEFATRYRDVVWPGAPILFNGVIDGTIDPAALGHRTTGVTMAFDVRGTLELGRALVPGARTLYLVAGNAPFDTRYLDFAVAQIAKMDRPLQPRFIVGASRDELLERIAKVEPDALVLYLTVLRDASGQVYPPAGGLLREAAQRSAAPMLAAMPTQLGEGPLASSASDAEGHGAAAGRLARAILAGANPDSIPVRAVPPPECRVDWNGLRRWGIDEAKVPSNCRLVGEPPSLFVAYFWPVIGMLALILVEAALIWALVLQSRRRRLAEAALHARNAEVARAARSSMLGALTASIAHEINQPMGAILSNADAAEMMLDQGTLDVPKLREILADIRQEDLRASEVIRGLRRLLGRAEPHVAKLDLNAELASALQHLAFEAARRDIRLLPSFDGMLPPVTGDAVQLQQVVMNLVINAMDALASSPEPWRDVKVQTRMREGGAEIVVSDQGPGIAPELAHRLFESIFSTKKDGMGLGLSIVRNIIEQHGGRVAYEPNLPHGSIFRVWIPGART